MFQTFNHNYSRFGLTNALYDAIYRSINNVTSFENLKGMIATEDKLALIELPEDSNFTIKFLDQDELLQQSKDPENRLSQRFLDTVFEKNDHCLAIMDGDKIASYGWYSNKPTRILQNIDLHYSSDWVYMYNGLTKPDYRGMRLHAVGMSYATRYFTEQGYKGLISYVESNNFASMKSVTRMGYEIFGSIYILSAFDRFISFSSAGCKDYGFFAGLNNGVSKGTRSSFFDDMGRVGQA